MQTLMAAPNKDFLRVMVKLLSDYADEDNAHACLLDVARRSANGSLEEQERFVVRLTELGSKKLRKFVKVRVKETLTDPRAAAKFVNVCLAYTPTKPNKPGKEVALTFGEMVADPRFADMVDAVRKRNPEITELHTEVATSLLRHKSIAKMSVAMIVECQMYCPKFLQNKKLLHGLYKFGRPPNLVDLAKDLVKFAVNPDMAHTAEKSQRNEACRLRTRVKLRKLAATFFKGTSRWQGFKLAPASALQVKTLDLGGSWAMSRMSEAEQDAEIETSLEHCEAFQVQELSLRCSGLGGGVAVARALGQNSALQSLDLHGTKLRQAGSVAVIRALEQNSALQTLGLSRNNLGEAGGVAMARALEQNSALQDLRLHMSNLGEVGGVAVARALEQNSSLQSLGLNGNKLREAGGVAVARALERNSALLKLSIVDNNIGEAGGVALARALEQNSTLQTLGMQNNNIGKAGGMAMARALEQNSALQHLDLGLNELGEAGGLALARALEQNSTLKTLTLLHTNLGKAAAKAIKTAWDKAAGRKASDLKHCHP